MRIDIVPNRGSTPAVLLRESRRQGAKVRKRTPANLSSLAPEQIAAIRAAPRGETTAPRGRGFDRITASLAQHRQTRRFEPGLRVCGSIPRFRSRSHSFTSAG